MSALNCACTSAADHEALCKAHLCGNLDAVSEPPSPRSTSPFNLPPNPASSLPSRKARFDRYRREIHEKNRRTFLEKKRTWSCIPDFYHSCWHLSHARKCSNGYQGCSAAIKEGIPAIPKDADGPMHLKILRDHGYTVIKAPEYAF
jgi:hypothetical protein